jgi:preprotein translocase subunit SecA
VVDELVDTHCTGDFGEEWDVETLLADVATYWPSELDEEKLRGAVGTDEVYDILMEEAVGYYERREEELGAESLREIERQVSLRLIDQHWREHLHEMDHLEQGIHLRAMGQKDPLVEWQREGFDMFGAMMRNIARDEVKFVMHVQVVVEDKESEGAPEKMVTSGPSDPSESGSSRMKAAAAAQAQVEAEEGAAPEVVEEASQAPVVKSEWDKTPRNAPCPCGSGKKFKLCHGKA